MGGLGLIFLGVLALAIAAGAVYRAVYQWVGAARDARRLPAPGRATRARPSAPVRAIGERLKIS